MSGKSFALSVKVMIQNSDGRYLLLRRSNISKAHAGKWEMPGGKIDPCETFDEALLREVSEETGLAISLQHLSGTFEYELPSKMIVYLIMSGIHESGEVVLSEEHDDFRWVDVKNLVNMDLAEQFVPFMAEFCRKYL